MTKLNIKELKKIIAEVKTERQWHNKFIKSFVDVRVEQPTISEQQLDSMADHLYELLQKKP